jgi:hypothetical protein
MDASRAKAARTSTVRGRIVARVAYGARPRPRLPLAVALAVVALAAAGCGSRPDPLQQAKDAAKKTLALPGVGYDVRLSGQKLFPGLLGGKALYDLSSGLGYEALTLQAADGSQRKLFLDFLPGSFYVQPYPAPAGLLPEGKFWVSVPVARGGPVAAQAGGLAPELALSEILWGGESAKHVGTPVVSHVPMDEYRVTVNLEQALAQSKKSGRPAIAAAIAAELKAGGSKRVPVTVWVNGPGYAARIEKPVPGTGLGTATFTLSSFSVKFARTNPDPTQVVPLGAVVRPGRTSVWALSTGS